MYNLAHAKPSITSNEMSVPPIFSCRFFTYSIEQIMVNILRKLCATNINPTSAVALFSDNYGHYWHLPQQMFTLPQSAPKHKRQTLIGLPLV
jgi:hypothetical protein